MPRSPSTTARIASAYAVALVVLGALDAAWLGWLARDFYARELGALMTDAVRVGPAALYYLLYPAAIVGLALTPRPSGFGVAALRSAALGATAFGVYDLTNLATLRGYGVAMTVVDIAWGTFASAVAGATAYAVPARRAGR